jgi:hypothetical protein
LRFTPILAVAAALSLASAPAVAQTTTRASAPAEQSSDLLGNSSLVIAVGAAFAVLLIVAFATGGGEDGDAPTSP